MKKQLSPGAIVGSLIATVVVIAIVAFVVFKPSLGPGPVVAPRKFTPPPGYTSKAGQPIGAPSNAPAGQSK